MITDGCWVEGTRVPSVSDQHNHSIEAAENKAACYSQATRHTLITMSTNAASNLAQLAKPIIERGNLIKDQVTTILTLCFSGSYF